MPLTSLGLAMTEPCFPHTPREKKFHKGSCGTLCMNERINRPGIAKYASSTYRDVLVGELTSALVYLLERLNDQCRISLACQKTYASVWKSHVLMEV